MARYTITPWRTQSDLLAVRAQLYQLQLPNPPLPNNNKNTNTPPTDSRRHAISRIMAWKLRGNLPHAIESTALLLDAILHHQQSQKTAANNTSIFSIRAVYSAAFCRFVTGFCDIGRSREKGRLEASSMLEIARQIDMPAEFVTLRHEATHEELPGVQRLVGATERALEWLWRVYWSRLEEREGAERAGEGEVVGEDLVGQARRLLKGFRTRRREDLKGRAGGVKRVEQGDVVKQAVGECFALDCREEVRAQAVAKVLVEEKLMFPTTRRLGATLDGAFLIWDDFLRLVSDRQRRNRPSQSIVFAIVEASISLLTSDSKLHEAGDSDCDATVLWLLHLIHIQDTGHAVIEDSDTRERTRREVIQSCCLHPGYWTEQLGERILVTAPADFQEEWADVFASSRLPLDIAMADSGPESDDEDGAMTGKTGPEDQLAIFGPLDAPSWSRVQLMPTTPIGVVI